MARSFSNTKVLSNLITSAINGRGFATVAPQVIKGGAAGGGLNKKREDVVRPTEEVAWIPDPRTGCYRPENVANVVDAAELRAQLLKKH
ncbi:senescence-associated gene 21 [Euphorbia peplus]|nr:senescence-associated gene 21 [Euphorbia peplus]